jgi:rubrerythrin
MTTGETGFSDVVYDLISVQYHALKAEQHYGQYIRDAENGGHADIAEFFRAVRKEDSERGRACHHFLSELSGTQAAGPAVT